ncbi:hypothetical protein GCM10009773_02340 [Williamsia serinedens]
MRSRPPVAWGDAEPRRDAHPRADGEHQMSNFPHDKESQVGETEEIRREEKVYEAGQSDADEPTGEIDPGEHSFGGSDGTTDGT